LSTGERDISRFLETVYGVIYSPKSISRLTKVVEEEVRDLFQP